MKHASKQENNQEQRFLQNEVHPSVQHYHEIQGVRLLILQLMQQEQHYQGSTYLKEKGYVMITYNSTNQELVWLCNQKNG